MVFLWFSYFDITRGYFLDETFHVQSQLIEACWKCHWKLPALRSQQRGRSRLGKSDKTKHLIFLFRSKEFQGFGEHVLMIIDDYWWLLMIIEWLLMIVDDYWWLLMIIDDYWMIIDDYWIIIDDYWCVSTDFMDEHQITLDFLQDFFRAWHRGECHSLSRETTSLWSPASPRALARGRVEAMRDHWQSFHEMALSENVVYPEKPNGFADHYPVSKWLFHWGHTPFSDIPKYMKFEVDWSIRYWLCCNIYGHCHSDNVRGPLEIPGLVIIFHHFPISNTYPSNTHSHPSWTIIWEIFGTLPTSHDLKHNIFLGSGCGRVLAPSLCVNAVFNMFNMFNTLPFWWWKTDLINDNEWQLYFFESHLLWDYTPICDI